MSTLERIKAVLDKFNRDAKYQANFTSEHFRDCLALAVYDAVMKQGDCPTSSTFNADQLELFSNIDTSETK